MSRQPATQTTPVPTPPPSAKIIFRRPQPADFPALLQLMQEHARHENLPPPPAPTPEAMQKYLVEGQGGIFALLVETPAGLQGYATGSPEFSSWSCTYYLHMDCLYLCPAIRRQGIGRQIMAHIIHLARQQGYSQIQWQTPPDNIGAIRFYEAIGADSLDKKRFTLVVRTS